MTGHAGSCVAFACIMKDGKSLFDDEEQGGPLGENSRKGTLCAPSVNRGYTREAAIRPNKHHRTGNDHTFAGQKSDDLMPKQMRIDPFFDPSSCGVLVDDLSDATTGVRPQSLFKSNNCRRSKE